MYCSVFQNVQATRTRTHTVGSHLCHASWTVMLKEWHKNTPSQTPYLSYSCEYPGRQRRHELLIWVQQGNTLRKVLSRSRHIMQQFPLVVYEVPLQNSGDSTSFNWPNIENEAGRHGGIRWWFLAFLMKKVKKNDDVMGKNTLPFPLMR